jgi:tetratricopeptide (TPR) repeat protein
MWKTAFIFLLLGFAQSVFAELSPAWTDCKSKDDAPAGIQLRITACTAVIQSGNESLDNLAGAHYNRAIALNLDGDPDRAVADFNEAIRLKPDFASAYNNRGVVYRQTRDYDRAIKDFDVALRLKPGDLYALNNRGNAYRDKRDAVQAMNDFNEAIRLAPDFATSFVNRAAIYRERGKFDLALKDIGHALKLAPDYPAALSARCFTRAAANRELGIALADCEKSLVLRPGDADTFAYRGFVKFRRGQFTASIEDCNHALELDNHLAGSLFVRGLAKHRLKMIDEADTDIIAAKKLDPGVVQTYSVFHVGL